MKTQVTDLLAMILQGPCPMCSKMISTGHSLGAAIAGIAALELQTLFPLLSVRSYTFGQPRLGDANFSRFYGSVVPLTQRMVHYQDIVPHYPFVALGYHHVASEIWEITNASMPLTYIICDKGGEDPFCSDSVPAKDWHPKQHMVYMNITENDCGTINTTSANENGE